MDIGRSCAHRMGPQHKRNIQCFVSVTDAMPYPTLLDVSVDRLFQIRSFCIGHINIHVVASIDNHGHRGHKFNKFMTNISVC
jgi:hypothetical protein